MGRAAYGQLNEGLATALGNGWFEQAVSGQLPKGAWYADPVIDAFGRALYPLARPYVEAGRPMEEALVERIVAAFKSTFPRALDDFLVVAQNFLVITNHPEAHSGSFQREVMRLGPVRQSGVAGPGKATAEAGFVVFWLDRDRLTQLGWNADQLAGDYALRRQNGQWQLAYWGTEASGLLSALKELAGQRYLQER